jgi:competence protein ComFC
MKRPFGLADFAADLIAPNRCPFCGEFIVWNSFACGECLEKARRCSFREPPNYCEKAFAAFVYEGDTVNAVYKFKYKHSAAFAALAAYEIVNSGGFSHGDYDLLVPVPMHKEKSRSRFYNPAEIFAKRLRKFTGIPVMGNALYHEKTDLEQHTLNESQRFINAQKVYRADKAEAAKGKRILLCDDVITTGATIGVCAKILYDCGAKSVSAAACTATELNCGKLTNYEHRN